MQAADYESKAGVSCPGRFETGPRDVMDGVKTYVAFLRGINVGGRKLIKMQDLVRVFVSARFQNVRTFQAAGNVVFEANEIDEETLRKKIEARLRKAFGHEVSVVIRTLEELQDMLRHNPFKKFQAESNVMLTVAFLQSEPRGRVQLPLRLERENLDVFEIRDRAAFVLARRRRTGSFGFPNNFVEKELGVIATTRQWSTVNKLVAFAHRQ